MYLGGFILHDNTILKILGSFHIFVHKALNAVEVFVFLFLFLLLFLNIQWSPNTGQETYTYIIIHTYKIKDAELRNIEKIF